MFAPILVYFESRIFSRFWKGTTSPEDVRPLQISKKTGEIEDLGGKLPIIMTDVSNRLMDVSGNSGFSPKSSIKKWGFPLFSPSILGVFPPIFGFPPKWNLCIMVQQKANPSRLGSIYQFFAGHFWGIGIVLCSQRIFFSVTNRVSFVPGSVSTERINKWFQRFFFVAELNTTSKEKETNEATTKSNSRWTCLYNFSWFEQVILSQIPRRCWWLTKNSTQHNPLRYLMKKNTATFLVRWFLLCQIIYLPVCV